MTKPAVPPPDDKPAPAAPPPPPDWRHWLLPLAFGVSLTLGLSLPQAKPVGASGRGLAPCISAGALPEDLIFDMALGSCAQELGGRIRSPRPAGFPWFVHRIVEGAGYGCPDCRF